MIFFHARGEATRTIALAPEVDAKLDEKEPKKVSRMVDVAQMVVSKDHTTKTGTPRLLMRLLSCLCSPYVCASGLLCMFPL